MICKAISLGTKDSTHLSVDVGSGVAIGQQSNYLTTCEAAKYLRMSVSQLMRLGDLAYLKGRPNIYDRRDLDDWFARHKYNPLQR